MQKEERSDRQTLAGETSVLSALQRHVRLTHCHISVLSYFCPVIFSVTRLAPGLCSHRGLPRGDSGGPAAQDHRQDHGSADHNWPDHQGRADRCQRPPLVEGVAQLSSTAARKNTRITGGPKVVLLETYWH